ncbi:MAG: HD domain-containing protein [Rhodospirillales bacterium]|nr:HD domain-containing protein [Rhodospirillales bacterium]
MTPKLIRVLLIEDNPGDARLIREHLTEVAGPDLTLAHVLRLSDGLERLAAETFDVVLLDLSLPDSQGLATLRAMLGQAGDIPVIVLTGLADDATAVAAMKSGAQDYLVKGRGDGDTVLRAIRYAIERQHLEEARLADAARLQRALMQTIQAVSLTIEKRDPYTAGHQQRVSKLAGALGAELGFSDERRQGLELGSLIHDIGKIAIPSSFLNKPGRLTSTEFELIKSHSQIGFDIVKDVEFNWPIAEMVYQHHERRDGSGYPQGLRGEAILLEARILGVADVIESMASHRPYRPALGIEAALNEIISKSRVLYDPQVTDAAVTLFREGRFSFDEA